MNIVLLGPPGAGKGTLSGLLKDILNVAHISTGDILREEMEKNTPLGQEAKHYIENGELVPDSLVTKLVRQKFASGGVIHDGFMLDGFPRTEVQAKELDKILQKVQQPIDYVIYLKATLRVILHRLTGRRVCRKCGAPFHIINKPPRQESICDVCGGELIQREDDIEETIKKRIEVYGDNTKPIVEYYKAQGKLYTLDGDKESDELQEILLRKFNEDGKLN